MKKVLVKDKKKIKSFFSIEKEKYVLSSIFNNFNFSNAIRRNANKKLHDVVSKNSLNLINLRCKITINKKNFNKLTRYSRHIFLKLIRSGKIYGIKKASW